MQWRDVSDAEVLVACIKAGVCDDVIATIVASYGDTAIMGPNDRQHLLAELADYEVTVARLTALFATLTPREMEVLDALMCGASADDIAEAQYVAITTVRSQIASLLRKLGVSTQLAAVALANQAGWKLDDTEVSVL